MALTTSYQLYDMHAHLGFAPDPCAYAACAAEHGIAFFSTTVTPQEYLQCEPLLASASNVVCGVGLHPWWLEADQSGVDEVCELIADTPFVGEIGMDASPRRAFFEAEQKEAFEKIVHACTRAGNRVLSIHSVSSASTVLDVLERAGAFMNCICVFHWFSGSMAEMIRAKNAGCFFSINPRMMQTRKGKEYVSQLPVEQLLLETDLPAEIAYDQSSDQLCDQTYGQGVDEAIEHHKALLEGVLDAIATAKKLTSSEEKKALAAQIRTTSAQILNRSV